jgi:hypothetical protein
MKGSMKKKLCWFSSVYGKLSRTVWIATALLAKLSVRSAASLAAAGLTLFATPAHATTWYQGAVQLVYPLPDGSFAIGVPTILQTCSGSGSGSYVHVTPGQNTVTLDGAKAMLATVLTAFSMGRTLSISYDSSTSYCYVDGLLIQ